LRLINRWSACPGYQKGSQNHQPKPNVKTPGARYVPIGNSGCGGPFCHRLSPEHVAAQFNAPGAVRAHRIDVACRLLVQHVKPVQSGGGKRRQPKLYAETSVSGIKAQARLLSEIVKTAMEAAYSGSKRGTTDRGRVCGSV
jgi:hypothetical protein